MARRKFTKSFYTDPARVVEVFGVWGVFRLSGCRLWG